MEIIAETLSEAHEAAVDAVLNTNKAIGIQTHPDKVEKTIEFEAEDGSDEIIVIKVRNPLAEPQVSAGARFGPGFTAAYKKQFLTLTPPRGDGKQATYTYWNRSEDYPWTFIESMDAGNGRGNGLKQITNIIEKLANDPNSRRGVAVTWVPELDMDSTEPPCMDWLQAVIRNGKVNLRVVFRSQDILSGLGENLVGCAALLEYIAIGISMRAKPYEVGNLILISTIPHIYNIRDSHEFQPMKVEINRKKTLGLWKVEVRR
jgi:thymidylate synthase